MITLGPMLSVVHGTFLTFFPVTLGYLLIFIFTFILIFSDLFIQFYFSFFFQGCIVKEK